MTIMNVIITEGRAALIADTAIAAPGDVGITSKSLALPHLSLICGAAGSLAVWLDLLRLLLGGMPVGTTAADLAATLPEFLRDSWQRTQRAPTSIVMAGVGDDGDIEASIFSSPHFAPQRLAPGVWLQPGILEDATTEPPPPSVSASRFDDTGEPAVLAPPRPWVHDFSQSLEICLAAVRQQRAQRRTTSGGSLELVSVASHGISAWRLEDNLDLVAPA